MVEKHLFVFSSDGLVAISLAHGLQKQRPGGSSIMTETRTIQPDRICGPRSAGNTTTGHFGLPNDVMDRAVMRLVGWA
jgi:hypothetical protein